ncbi:hypothetical protein LCGC14_1967580 [marine sediment metagenome]|uniref:Uncharacterized protein n=1 Tax=marine sediment metagenome TaxID=412755 RepID=A0A0F9I9P2_9ZZZZ
MRASGWITATIDIDRDTEFTGDDVDQFSSLVDLGDNFEFVTVHFDSVITSSTINPWVQKTKEVDEVPVVKHVLDDDATGSFAHATSAAVTQVSVTFRIGGYQYLRIRAGTNQSADETFSVRGFNSG